MRWLTLFLATLALAGAAVAEPLRFRSHWLDPGGGGGDTPIEFEPIDGSAGKGGAWVGRYPFGGGAFYGCYDAASRVFVGVWTQESQSTSCAEKRFGAEIWGVARLEFDVELRRFEGWYTFCDEPQRYGWSGERDPGLGAVDGGEIRGAPLCEPGLTS